MTFSIPEAGPRRDELERRQVSRRVRSGSVLDDRPDNRLLMDLARPWGGLYSRTGRPEKGLNRVITSQA